MSSPKGPNASVPSSEKAPSLGQRRATLADKFLEQWWVSAPARLNRYSSTLAAAWQDGIYLTAWPRVGIFLPLASLLVGIIAGVFHWQFLSISDLAFGYLPAVVFAQSLLLLICAVVVGTLSANSGLMLVLGYSLGDYLSGRTWPAYHRYVGIDFLQVRVPQLATYLLFFALSVLPVVMTAYMLVGLRRILPGTSLRSVLARAAAAALVQSWFVYEWTFIAAMSIHPVWRWVESGSPVTVRTFHRISAPWLIAAVIVGVVARTVLTLKAENNISLPRRLHRMVRAHLKAAGEPATFVKRHRWPGAILAAVWMTLLPLGFIGSPLVAAEILCAIIAVLLVRLYLLPQLQFWSRWSRVLSKVPPIFRLAAAVLGGYYLTLSIVGSGMLFDTRNFDRELISVGFGALLLMILLPEGFSVPAAPLAERDDKVDVQAWSAVRSALIILGVLLFTSKKVYAQCAGPGCCLGMGTTSAASTSGYLPFLAGGWGLPGGPAAAGAGAAADAGAHTAAYGSPDLPGSGYAGSQPTYGQGQSGIPSDTPRSEGEPPPSPPWGGDWKDWVNWVRRTNDYYNEPYEPHTPEHPEGGTIDGTPPVILQ